MKKQLLLKKTEIEDQSAKNDTLFMTKMAATWLNSIPFGNDDPAGIRWINSDLIAFSYRMKNTKAKTDTTQDDFLKVYYISAGQTSLLQVQWKILHRTYIRCVGFCFCILWGRTYLWSPYVGVAPPPPLGGKLIYCPKVLTWRLAVFSTLSQESNGKFGIFFSSPHPYTFNSSDQFSQIQMKTRINPVRNLICD